MVQSLARGVLKHPLTGVPWTLRVRSGRLDLRANVSHPIETTNTLFRRRSCRTFRDSGYLQPLAMGLETQAPVCKEISVVLEWLMTWLISHPFTGPLPKSGCQFDPRLTGPPDQEATPLVQHPIFGYFGSLGINTTCVCQDPPTKKWTYHSGYYRAPTCPLLGYWGGLGKTSSFLVLICALSH